MSNSNITKMALATSLKACMQEKPLDKISIGEICSRCDLNRKSFYYHFKDKYELVNWIYDTEINRQIQSEVKTRKSGELAQKICTYIYENRKFYLNALQVSGPHSFHDYFCRQIEPMVTRTLGLQQGDVTISAEELSDLIGDFCLSAIRRWLAHNNPMKPEVFLENLIQVSVSLSGKMISLFL